MKNVRKGIDVEYKAEHVGAFSNRDEVADWYADIIRYAPNISVADINDAICQRWSYSALNYIKTKAWKIAYPTNKNSMN